MLLFASHLYKRFFQVFCSLVFALSVSAVFSFALAPSVLAHHTDMLPCRDITGSGMEILHEGTANSGVITFDPNPNPNHYYEACLRDPGNDGIGPFRLEGWAWNSNLGWISLYCNNTTNLGVNCGSINYGVTVLGPEAGANAGKLQGFAWGDNVGWISFSCQDLETFDILTCGTGAGQSDYEVQFDVQNASCLGRIYSSNPPAGCEARPSRTTHAWSDSVGWIDFSGVTFPWIYPPITSNLDVNLEITPDPWTVMNNKNLAPAANNEPYTLRLTFLDEQTGEPIDASDYNDYNFTVNFNWQDSVDADQTSSTQGNYNTNNNGAVTKPLSASDFTLRNGAYEALVTSVAPTSDMNVKVDQNGVITFSYEDFILPNALNNVPHNLLNLNGVRVAITRNSDGGCVFGTGAECAPDYVPLPGNSEGVPFNFKPALETSLSANGNDYFAAQHNVVTRFQTSATCSSYTTGMPTGQILNCSTARVRYQFGVDEPFKFVYAGDDDEGNFDDPDFVEFARSQIPASLIAVPVLAEGEQAPAQVANAYVYSVVNYTLNGKTVRYYSDKLPRVQGTIVVNPVASIRGNVYSTGVTNPQEGVAIRSLGDVTTNNLRDTIYRNVTNIIAGIPASEQPNGQNVTISSFNNENGFVSDNANAIKETLPDAQNIPRVYYAKGDVYLKATSEDLNWTGERTIIIIGGDLHIRSNLYNSQVAPKPRLGIIVLKDLSTGMGGNIYVAPEVTNIQANMFADGAFFSYNPDAIYVWQNPLNPIQTANQPGLCQDAARCTNTFGEPLFVSEDDRRALLQNQLFIEGSIASYNTLGGAVASTPFLGDGRPQSPQEGAYGMASSGRSRARMYDLNFLRYYGPVFLRDANGNARDYDNDGTLEPKIHTEGGDLVTPLEAGLTAKTAKGLNPAVDINAVHIYFNPPSPTLPGFGVLGGLDIRRRPQ